MLQKNIEKEKRKNRKNWVGLCPKKMKTKSEKKRSIEKKHKGKFDAL